MFPKTNCGRRGLPKDVIDEMYAQYQSGLSLAEVGKLNGRTRQSIYDILRRRGLKRREKQFKEPVIYRGRKYTPSKGDYLRDTIFRNGKRGPAERQLHRVIWEEAHGPIPAGHQVMFKDGNKRNFDLSNLECLPAREVSSRTATGENQFTRTARARLELLKRNFDQGRRSLATGLK